MLVVPAEFPTPLKVVYSRSWRQFFQRQAQQLYDALRCPRKLIRSTREQGAEQHSEVAAPGLRDSCVYNWLADVLG